MHESQFLHTISDYLEALGVVLPGRANVVEPEGTTDLPALVLSLDSVERTHRSLGERTEVMQGALRVTARIDLENPALETDSDVDLVDEVARVVQVPHGGLVKQSGGQGALDADDLTVSVAGTAYAVVATAPGANQVRADPVLGQLAFGNDLPSTGLLEATYFVGRWERRSVTLRGVLRVDACAESAAAVQSLSDAALSALGQLESAMFGLHSLEVWRLAPIVRVPPDATFRRRSLELRFEYEAVIDRPEASGGVIRTVRVKPPSPTPPGSTGYESFEVG